MDNGEEAVTNEGDGKAKANEGTESEAKAKQPLAPRHRTVWGISYIKRKLQEREAKREQQSPTDKAAHVTAVATFWIALFTFVLAILSALTWCDIHTGGVDTHELAKATKRLASAGSQQASFVAAPALQTKSLADRMKEQADHTLTLATAAQKANAIAKTASTAVQRAFIVVDKLEIFASRGPSGEVITWIVNPVVVNSGSTPTVNLYFDIGFTGSGTTTVDKEPPYDPPNFPSLADIRRHDTPAMWKRGVVGPHASVTNFTVLNGFNASGFNANLWTNTGTYTWGAFIYGDVFDDRPRHVTEFCFVMDRPGMVNNQFLPYQRCNHHNCADQECQAEERDQKAN